MDVGRLVMAAGELQDALVEHRARTEIRLGELQLRVYGEDRRHSGIGARPDDVAVFLQQSVHAEQGSARFRAENRDAFPVAAYRVAVGTRQRFQVVPVVFGLSAAQQEFFIVAGGRNGQHRNFPAADPPDPILQFAGGAQFARIVVGGEDDFPVEQRHFGPFARGGVHLPQPGLFDVDLPVGRDVVEPGLVKEAHVSRPRGQGHDRSLVVRRENFHEVQILIQRQQERRTEGAFGDAVFAAARRRDGIAQRVPVVVQVQEAGGAVRRQCRVVRFAPAGIIIRARREIAVDQHVPGRDPGERNVADGRLRAVVNDAEAQFGGVAQGMEQVPSGVARRELLPFVFVTAAERQFSVPVVDAQEPARARLGGIGLEFQFISGVRLDLEGLEHPFIGPQGGERQQAGDP